MGSRMFVSMDVAIIGTGRLAATLTRKLVAAGHKVIMGLKTGEQAPQMTKQTSVRYMAIAEAAKAADMIIIATPAEEAREAAYLLGDVRRKVVLDYTSFNPATVSNPVSTILAIQAITGTPHVVKCYKQTGYEDLIIQGINDVGIDLFIAGGTGKAKALVEILAADMGFEKTFDFGDAEAISMLDEMALCRMKGMLNAKTRRVSVKVMRK